MRLFAEHKPLRCDQIKFPPSPSLSKRSKNKKCSPSSRRALTAELGMPSFPFLPPSQSCRLIVRACPKTWDTLQGLGWEGGYCFLESIFCFHKELANLYANIQRDNECPLPCLPLSERKTVHTCSQKAAHCKPWQMRGLWVLSIHFSCLKNCRPKAQLCSQKSVLFSGIGSPLLRAQIHTFTPLRAYKQLY